MKFTHVGKIRGCDARTKPGTYRVSRLRESAKFWITENGTKYRKASGNMAGDEPWPMWYLDLSSIKLESAAEGKDK